MHSSIQFRHEAISTYSWRRLRSLWLFRSNTLLADSDMCWRVFFVGEKFADGNWSQRAGCRCSSSILGLDCVSLVVSLQVVCLLQLVTQTVSPVCHWEARSLTQTGQKWSGITLICRLLRGGPWGWMCQSGLYGPLCGLVGLHRSPQTLFPPPFS